MGKPKNFQHSQINWMSSWRGSIDEIVTCPYDKRHIMPYKRLMIHIIACENNHAELSATFVTCPYSSMHRFPKNDLQEHLKTCKEHQMILHNRVKGGKRPYIEPSKGPRDEIQIHERDKSSEIKEEFDPQHEAEWNDML